MHTMYICKRLRVEHLTRLMQTRQITPFRKSAIQTDTNNRQQSRRCTGYFPCKLTGKPTVKLEINDIKNMNTCTKTSSTAHYPVMGYLRNMNQDSQSECATLQYLIAPKWCKYFQNVILICKIYSD